MDDHHLPCRNYANDEAAIWPQVAVTPGPDRTDAGVVAVPTLGVVMLRCVLPRLPYGKSRVVLFTKNESQSGSEGLIRAGS